MQSGINAIVRERIRNFLIPLFLQDANDDADRARQAVDAMLESYDPRTTRELRLAALAIAFSLGALDALAKSASQDATLSQVLRLRGSANALARSSEKAEAALQAERVQPGPENDMEITLPASIDPHALVEFAKAHLPLTRQQRRLAERQAEKHRRRQEQVTRQAMRTVQQPAAAAAG
ncbi:MAG TPA: hypothetical protein VHB27_22380 [Rhodopila sp.]|uniref:hypothetical protein n=1 Tax=Rhodopila sp. TaxID=2480087 RepID=UPI002BE0BE32|nr:hypothetical protein [Rhodopila sp.]HVY17983.1 hypothetical protein [Rhodopila sp.]HWC00249.1 hypothetical protein [Bryobacteraceae bacterium]